MHQQRELVTAHPRQQVALPQARLASLGHLDQHAVAHFGSQTVVDLFEAVEVELQQRKAGAIALRMGQR
ncbi:MAG: hypothetical protein ABWZ88_01615, partial [Variovorax sp.]